MKESEIFSGQNLTEKIHYVYRVVIDGKYYGGKHSGFLDDLHTGVYETSSKLVKEKLKNGKTFSKIKIIRVFSTSEEALEYEERYLTRVNARRNTKFLNQNNGDKNFYNKQHTEKAKEKISENQRKRYDENTEQGIKNREVHSNKMKEHFNPNTEEGRKNLEKAKVYAQKGVETKLQKRINDSILGELMFNEAFIRENFLIIDDKNNLRFLWSVYSKLSGYCESNIILLKREGKLSFLSGIKSISISEELENSKIKEIEEIIKRRNEKE